MDPSALFGSPEGGSTSFVLSVVLGLVGMAYFSYGKKLGKPLSVGCGLGLMVFPYFVSSTGVLLGLGGVLSALPFLIRG
jgi:hypothetical protein